MRKKWKAMPLLAVHEVVLPNLAPEHEGLRIAHLTDVHCGKLTSEEHVRSAVDLVNQTKPDAIVMTGDYVNWHRDEIAIAKDHLSGLQASHVFATLGNHDYFAWGDGMADALEHNGYDVLRNESRVVKIHGQALSFVGIDDPVTRRHHIAQSFRGVDQAHAKIVLCHCPEQLDEISQFGADLVLAGHTHGGQVNVKGITQRLFKAAGRKYVRGFYEREATQLYVSSGVGFSGVRMRVGQGTGAEVSLFILRSRASWQAEQDQRKVAVGS